MPIIALLYGTTGSTVEEVSGLIMLNGNIAVGHQERVLQRPGSFDCWVQPPSPALRVFHVQGRLNIPPFIEIVSAIHLNQHACQGYPACVRPLNDQLIETIVKSGEWATVYIFRDERGVLQEYMEEALIFILGLFVLLMPMCLLMNIR